MYGHTQNQHKLPIQVGNYVYLTFRYFSTQAYKLKMVKKSIGYNIDNMPQMTDGLDKKSPFHGTVKVRGKTFEGKVVSDSMTRTVKVERETLVKDSKYNRYLKKRTKVSAHNPDSISAKVGDRVLIGETRPLSKTKHFAVLKVLGRKEE